MLRNILMLLALICLAVPSAFADPVNAAIGDASWDHTKRGPADLADDTERIRTHLLYVVQVLEQRDVSALSSEAQRNRAELLGELADYARAEVFPRRTDHLFAGRRPQFIDSRGVHCAVGELMRLSGHEDLAQRIDAEAEFAYVPDIDVRGVDAWAGAHGFTREELAMIQPGYGPPPSKESIVAEVESEKMGVAIECGRTHGIPDSIMLHLRGNRSGEVRVALAESETPFGICFLEKLRVGGGAWDRQPRAFNTRQKFKLSTAQELAESALAIESLAQNNCRVRPGELPTSVSVHYVANRDFASLDVRTTPTNAEVEICIADYLRSRVHHLSRGNWTIDVKGQTKFKPRMNDDVLQQWLTYELPQHATACFANGEPEEVTAEVVAVKGAKTFEITVTGGNDEFAGCVIAALDDRLRSNASVSRRLYGESEPRFERYFRLDANATARLSISVEKPSERASRMEKERQERERRLEQQQYEY